jgi:hypothetical protein
MPTIVRAHQHSAGAQKKRSASHRPIPRRAKHQNPSARRRVRQSVLIDANFTEQTPSERSTANSESLRLTGIVVPVQRDHHEVYDDRYNDVCDQCDEADKAVNDVSPIVKV